MEGSCELDLEYLGQRHFVLSDAFLTRRRLAREECLRLRVQGVLFCCKLTSGLYVSSSNGSKFRFLAVGVGLDPQRNIWSYFGTSSSVSLSYSTRSSCFKSYLCRGVSLGLVTSATSCLREGHPGTQINPARCFGLSAAAGDFSCKCYLLHHFWYRSRGPKIEVGCRFLNMSLRT